MATKYKRILLKLSGEALQDTKDNSIFDPKKLTIIGNCVKEISDEGVEVCIVVGAGNIWRGKLAKSINIEPATADYMGMISTIVNAMAIANAVSKAGVKAKVLSALEVKSVIEPYNRHKAISYLKKKEVVVFAGGTGKPFFTTDTAASLRAVEVNCDAIFMAKNGVDGVYSDDPRINKKAEFIKSITYEEVLNRELKVMDATALTLVQDKQIPIHVFNMDKPENFLKVLHGEDIGTIIHKGE